MPRAVPDDPALSVPDQFSGTLEWTLAREGFSLCLAARTREELERTRELTGLPPRRSLIVLIDLAEEESAETLVSAALDCFAICWRYLSLISKQGALEIRWRAFVSWKIFANSLPAPH